MKSKINAMNKEKIKEAIDTVEKGCRKRLLDPERVQQAAEAAEKKLGALEIPKKYRRGCCVILHPERVPNAYVKKGRADGTYAIIERFPTSWFLMDISRRQCNSAPYGAPKRDVLHLCEQAIACLPTSFVI